MSAAMMRIALILLLYVLLTDAPHIKREAARSPVQVMVQAQPLPGPQLPVDGGIVLLHVWQLQSDKAAFGGISALLDLGHGEMLGLADSGEQMRFSLSGAAHPSQILPLPRLPADIWAPRWQQDSESVAQDAATGRLWVGFERVQRICRYRARFARIERCARPQAVQDWPEQGSLESLVRFGDGRFLAISERASRIEGGYDVLLWAGDPVEPVTPPPVHLRYQAPIGYRPTDALWLGGDHLLVLNRRLTVADGFSARLTLVRLPGLRAGSVLHSQVIARFERPWPTDNLEAMALGWQDGRPVLSIASDDNHMFLQRTLLFQFALPLKWVSDQPAP
jgi:hypothetical protein